MKTEIKEQQAVEQEIEQIRQTLRRICAEVDLAIRALQALLEAQGLRKKAESLGEELELLHQERDNV